MSPESVKMFTNSKEFNSIPRIGLYYFDINTARKPMDDPRVRKAFAIGFNREQVVRKVLQLAEKPAYGFIPYGIPYATKPTKNFRDIVPEPFKEDVALAKKLLAEAGYPDGKGFPAITLTVMNTQSNKDAAQAMQAMWKQNLGIEVSIVTYESKIYWDEMSNGNFFIMRDGWTGDYPDPMTNLDIFESVNTDDDNRWVNKEFDRLLAENRKISDPQKRIDNFVKAEKIMADDMPVFPLYYYTDTFVAKPYVKGVTKNFIGHTFFAYSYIE
jgi:oligopeptide transport system substrate-binding protein